jgi:predicted hotdog family 3-hydroxylacyl-ACP dehydratase
MNSDAIAQLLPHDGDMVLIDEIIAWDNIGAHCRAGFGELIHHPLQWEGRLSTAILVEYAAQAMAIHGALLEAPDHNTRSGRLVALPRLVLNEERMDWSEVIDIRVSRKGGDRSGAIYSFTVSQSRGEIANGQATVMFVEASQT